MADSTAAIQFNPSEARYYFDRGPAELDLPRCKEGQTEESICYRPQVTDVQDLLRPDCRIAFSVFCRSDISCINSFTKSPKGSLPIASAFSIVCLSRKLSDLL